MLLPQFLGTVEAMEATPRWARRDDGWWASVGATLALAAGLITAFTRRNALVITHGHHVDVTLVRIEVMAASALCAGILLARRRWPRLPTVVVVLVAFVPPAVLMRWRHVEGTMFLIVVAVSYVAITEIDDRTRLTVGVVAVALPAVIAYHTRYTWGWPYWMMGYAFAWLSGVQTRRFRQLIVELEATRERLAEQAVFTERRRIASELHDLVGHSLTVVLLFLTGARRRVHEDPSSAEDALREAEEIGRQSLADVRRSVATLREKGPPDLQPSPGMCDIPKLIEQARSAGSDVGLEMGGPVDQVEMVTALTVYRVIQESLANATKHAAGAVVTVRVKVDRTAVGVEVVDVGGSQSSGGVGGVGLIGRRERIEVLGGRLTAGPEPGGWRVSAVIPRGPEAA
jgi:signal transduction histidine kinase